MKLTIIRTTLIATALALTACSNDDDHVGMPMSQRSADDFNEADVMFVQGMISHHQQAIDMSDMILAKEGVHPDVTRPRRADQGRPAAGD